MASLKAKQRGDVVVVQSLGCARLFVTAWTTAHQASLSFTISRSLLRLMSIESVMPSNHLILCHPLLLLPSIFPSIRVFSNELVLHIRSPKCWSFSFSISPSSEYSGLISFRIDWFDLLAARGTLKSLLQVTLTLPKCLVLSFLPHHEPRLSSLLVEVHTLSFSLGGSLSRIPKSLEILPFFLYHMFIFLYFLLVSYPQSLHLQNPNSWMAGSSGCRVGPVFFDFLHLTMFSIKEPLQPNSLNKPCLVSCVFLYAPKWLYLRRRPLSSCLCFIFLLTLPNGTSPFQLLLYCWRTVDDSGTSSALLIPIRYCWALDGPSLFSVSQQQTQPLIKVVEFHAFSQLN